MHLIGVFNKVALTALLIATSSLIQISSQSEYPVMLANLVSQISAHVIQFLINGSVLHLCTQSFVSWVCQNHEFCLHDHIAYVGYYL